MPKRAVPPIPPPEDLLSLSLAAFSNARDLLSDARRLADAGSFPRAHALATFAYEEQGKSQLCHMMVGLSAFDIEPELFWEEFFAHRRKLFRAQGFSGLASSTPPTDARKFIDRLPQTASDAHQRRLRGLFVDYEDGAVQLPGDVTGPETWQLINNVEESLGFAEAAIAPLIDAPDAARDSVTAFATAFANQMRELVGEMREVLNGTDPNISFAALRDWFQQVTSAPSTNPDDMFVVARKLLEGLRTSGTEGK